MSASDIVARRLIRKHGLASIQITVTNSGIMLRAFAASYHPVVEQRRQAAFAALSGSISVEDAQKISEAAMREPLVVFRSTEIDLAIRGLNLELKKGLGR